MNWKTKTLKFFNEYAPLERLPADGLCGVADMGLICKDRFGLMHPTEDDLDLAVAEGTVFRYIKTGYWGCGLSIRADGDQRVNSFTPLRQTIVLFMANLNDDEL